MLHVATVCGMHGYVSFRWNFARWLSGAQQLYTNRSEALEERLLEALAPSNDKSRLARCVRTRGHEATELRWRRAIGIRAHVAQRRRYNTVTHPLFIILERMYHTRRRADPNVMSETGFTSLILAAAGGHLDVVKTLVEKVMLTTRLFA